MIGYQERMLAGTRKGESSRLLCDSPSWDGFAVLVRGGSRLMTTMMAGFAARSTDISVINRRSVPYRLPLPIHDSRCFYDIRCFHGRQISCVPS